MPKLGSHKRPAIVRVQESYRAQEILQICTENGWQVIIGLEPDKQEDISDVEKLLNPPQSVVSAHLKFGRNDLFHCGSGKNIRNVVYSCRRIICPKSNMKKIFLISILLIASNIQIFAAYPEAIPKGASSATQWIFKQANACLISDNIHRINANGECLALQTYYANNQFPHKNPRLIIYIHGDGIPGGSPSDYFKYQATKITRVNTISVVIIRPGYYDSYGNYSTGESHAFDCNGYPCDGYRTETVATLAAAIDELKKYYHPSCTILVGHSGGAMMSGVILGKYPHLITSAVLASVAYNVQNFAKRHKNWGDWSRSLTPDVWVNKIPKDTSIDIISGDKDEVTYPDLAEKYYFALRNAGLNAHFITVPGGTHNSVVTDDAKDLNNSINSLLDKCITH